MRYFNSLPNLITTDNKGNLLALKNLLVRTALIPKLQQNPLLFYKYDLQEGDTPEIVANKYYGDSYRYWIVLFANQMIDPQWDWPMNTNVFNDYIVDKYQIAAAASLNINVANTTPQQTVAYTQSTILNYYKTISTTDLASGNITTVNLNVSPNDYANIISTTQTNTFPTSNNQVTQTVTKYTETIYDYEVAQNESKRSIYLVNSAYVSQFETQLQSLMGA